MDIYETHRLKFVEAVYDDIEYIIEIAGKKENRDFIWQEDKIALKSEIEDKNQILLIIKEKESSAKIGFALARINPKTDVFELRRLAIDKKGRGYGKETLKGIIKYAFEEMSTNRFWLDVYEDNHIGISLYESIGMHKDGVLRQSDKFERGYLDQIIYSVLREEYKKCIQD